MNQCLAFFLLFIHLILGVFPDFSLAQTDREALHEVQSMPGAENTEERNLRIKVVEDTAMAAGIQAGVAWKYRKLFDEFEKRDTELCQIFDFGLLLLEGDVLPPVIVEVGPAIRVEKKSAYTSVIKHYKIIEDARFTSVPISWRDYFSYKFTNKESINAVLLPKNEQEKEIWKSKTREGFKKGVEHATILFLSQFSKLVRDFRGMILYHKLVKQNIITPPTIARGDYRTTVKDKELMIGERVFRVVMDSSFQDEKEWKMH